MKVKVGIVGVDNVTVTLYLARGTADTANMHKGNYQGVALAVARHKLECTVFPIAIDEPDWLPDTPVKAVKRG